MTDTRRVEAAIRQLRAEIDTLAGRDEEARQRLDRLVQDIEATLAEPKPTAAKEGLAGRVQASVLGFEVSHPRVAAVMNELVEQLGSMGI